MKNARLLLMLPISLSGLALPQDEQQAQGETPEAPHDPLSGAPNEARKDVMQLDPPVHGAELFALARSAYQRGFEYLAASQNKDGSWGSHHPEIAFLKDFGFGTANRGSQDGVRMACTAIVCKAFLRKQDRSSAEHDALARGIEALLKLDKFAYNMGEAFNTWGYGYKLDFLCDYLETEPGDERRKRALAAAKVCVEGLLTYQQADGGWNYYAGPMGGGESMSFNTANFAEALHRAAALGVEVPEGMVGDARKLLEHMMTARGGAVYDARFLHDPGSVNELSSAARTAALAECLAHLGVFGQGELERSLKVFNEGENWLEDGRKLIQPHTAVHQVSGYFFFYGYHYLSEFLSRMDPAAPLDRWERNAWTMIRTQEDDGRWWDTAAAEYGDKWGTGFALLTLQRYFEHCASGAAAELTGETTDTSEE